MRTGVRRNLLLCLSNNLQVHFVYSHANLGSSYVLRITWMVSLLAFFFFGFSLPLRLWHFHLAAKSD